jgi:hypothetical protein
LTRFKVAWYKDLQCFADVAQVVEQLIRNQQASSSSLLVGSSKMQGVFYSYMLFDIPFIFTKIVKVNQDLFTGRTMRYYKTRYSENAI